MKPTIHLSTDMTQSQHFHQMPILSFPGHVSFQLHSKMMLSTAKNMELLLFPNGASVTTAAESDQITHLENLPPQDMQLTETNVTTYAYVVLWYANPVNTIAYQNLTDILPNDALNMMNYRRWQNHMLAFQTTWDTTQPS